MRTAGLVVSWVPLVLLADQHATYLEQCGLGALTWLLLCVLLRREDRLTRAQVGVVVAYATVIEIAFSAFLQVYDYRLHEQTFWMRVPQFVPPGHGLVYLAALCVGRDPWVARHGTALIRTALAAGGAYALWGLTLATRLDVLGALWFGCLAWFLVRGRQPLVYVGAFVVVTWLEFVGTGLGTWAWAHHSPTGIIPMGNPPADAAGGYGFFDAAALLLGPWVASRFSRPSNRSAREFVDDRAELPQPRIGRADYLAHPAGSFVGVPSAGPDEALNIRPVLTTVEKHLEHHEVGGGEHLDLLAKKFSGLRSLDDETVINRACWKEEIHGRIKRR